VAMDGTTTYANKYFFDYSGLNLQETIASGWLSIVHPEMLEENFESLETHHYKWPRIP